MGKVVSPHSSTPNSQQGGQEFFPAMGADGDRREFDQQVGIKTLDLLGKSIPGGIMGGYLEPNFPLYYINDEILDYLGYTYEEFLEDTKGYVINCIHPDDREAVDRAVEEAFARDEEYTIQYRMRKRDGSYIWVSDIGKKGLAEDGREVCISVVRDISREVENKHKLEYEAKLKEQQASRYDKLFESVLCGIVQYRLKENGEFVFENANREAIRIFGYEPEEFWAKKDWNLPSLIVEEDRERIMDEVGWLSKVGDTSGYEYRVQQKDGSPCWIIGTAEVILNEEGKEIIQSVFLDIDKRKKTEQRNRVLSEQVEASNVVLQLALEHTTTCEFYYYPKRRLCVLPERLCTYYNTLPKYENAPYDLADSYVIPEHRRSFCEIFEKVSGGEKNASLEFKTTAGLWCRVTLSVISYLEDGRPKLVIGIIEDISRQKEMELALEDARSRDSLTGLYNKETGVRMVQVYMLKKPVTECCCLMLLDMDDLGEINKVEGNAFADAILQEVAAILKAETSEKDIQIRLGGDEFMLFIKNCKKQQATIIGPHIAEQVRSIIAWLLKELVKIVPSFCMKAKADAVSQAKTDFLSRMSHEIRTPMNAISGMTAIAKTVLDDKERAMDCLEKIESANTYLLNLINDILDMSRIESGKIEINTENINMGELIKNLEILLKPQAEEKGVALVIENGYGDERPLLGDELRLNQVLINIIGNAVKFTEKGGQVTVKVVKEWADRDSVRLHFSVQDTGIGIEPSALERIFNVFEQADKGTAARHGGTGLGLAISSSLVQLMGGVLEVKSQVGKGSEFYFTLPFEFGDYESAPLHENVREKNFDFTGKRILLAEDNALNQEIARTILEMQGIIVECANDGSEVLSMFKAHEPGYYDGILMDIRMPVMDGLEAARYIRTMGREDSRSIPIVALSANAFDEDSRKSLESGMNGHLSKPIQVEKLLEMLERVLC